MSFGVITNVGSDKTRKSSDGKYLSTPLPGEVQELGFDVGDTVYSSLESGKVDCIRYSSKEIGRHQLSIRNNNDEEAEKRALFVRIPIEYTFYREGQSFHGLDEDDSLIVELDYIENEFRVYRGDEYALRVNDLSESGVFPELKAPGIAGLGITVLNQLFLEEYAEITGVPRQVSAGEEFGVGVSVQLPGLKKVVVQLREEDEPGFTDVETVDEISGDELAEQLPVAVSGRGVYHVRLYVEYRNGSKSSEAQTVEAV